MQHQSDPAWAFVTRNQSLIAALAGQVARAVPGVDAGDVQQDLALYVYERHERYDPAISCESTWITHQARGVRQNYVRRRKRSVARTASIDPDHRVGEHPGAIMARAELAIMVDRVTPEQRTALESALEGLTGPEIKARHGVTYNGHKYRLRGVAERFADYATEAP